MRTRFLLGAALAVGLSPMAAAQPVSPERAAAFEAMYASPGDIGAMLTYARAAVADRAFEDAAATLERVVDLDPANLGARLDLAIAYYAIGAYSAARYHFDIVAGSPAATLAQRDLVAAYLTDIDRNTGGSAFSGFVEAGLAYSVEAEETGFAVGAGLVHSADLGGPRENLWITEFRVAALSFGGDDGRDQLGLIARTGPRFSINGDAFGPTLRPYLEAEIVDDNIGTDETTYGIGVEYFNVVSAQVGVFAGLEFGVIDPEAGDEGGYGEGFLGLTYRPVESTRLRFTIRVRSEDPDDAGRIDSYAARLDARHDFDPGFNRTARDWSVLGYLSYQQEDFVDSFFDRTDDLFGAGLGLRAFVTDAVYIEGMADFVERDSSADANDVDDTILRLTVGLEF